MTQSKKLPTSLRDARPAMPVADGLPTGRIEPIRSQEEYNNIPCIDLAVGFAEALNTTSLSRLSDILSEEVDYHSEWTGVRFKGRDMVLRWFDQKFLWVQLAAIDRRYSRYHAQVVVLPNGHAAVLMQTKSSVGAALTQLKGEQGQATSIYVTGKFNRRELRETRYFPPEA